jgi:putative sigma-54 modulation protein
MVAKARIEDESSEGYRIEVIGRHLHVTEAMKNHAIEKISKIDRFHNHVIDVHVTMDIQREDHTAVILVIFDHFKIKVSATTADMYASIDKAVDKLRMQLRRWKDRIHDHRKKGPKIYDMKINVLERPFGDTDEVTEINAAIEAANLEKNLQNYRPAKIIGTDSRPLKHLTTDEAVMKMELSGDAFMLFRCEEDEKLKLIYRRSDGNYGIILPE